VGAIINAPLVSGSLQPDDRLRLFSVLNLLTDPKDVPSTICLLAYLLWGEFLAGSPVQLRMQHYRLNVNYLLLRIPDPEDEKALLPMAIIDLVHIPFLATVLLTSYVFSLRGLFFGTAIPCLPLKPMRPAFYFRMPLQRLGHKVIILFLNF